MATRVRGAMEVSAWSCSSYGSGGVTVTYVSMTTMAAMTTMACMTAIRVTMTNVSEDQAK